ncbi:hypothetical protein ABPG72_002091 [Tetrahymena utriculariae]
MLLKSTSPDLRKLKQTKKQQTKQSIEYLSLLDRCTYLSALQRELRKIVVKLKSQSELYGEPQTDINNSNSNCNQTQANNFQLHQNHFSHTFNDKVSTNQPYLNNNQSSNPKYVLNFLYKDKLKSDSFRQQNQCQINYSIKTESCEKGKFIVSSPVSKLINPLSQQIKSQGSQNIKIVQKQYKCIEENSKFAEDQIEGIIGDQIQANLTNISNHYLKFNSSNTANTLQNSCDISQENSPFQQSMTNSKSYKRKNQFSELTSNSQHIQNEGASRQNSMTNKSQLEFNGNGLSKDIKSDRPIVQDFIEANTNVDQSNQLKSQISNYQISNNIMMKHIKTTVTNLVRNNRNSSKDVQLDSINSNSMQINENSQPSARTQSKETRFNNFIEGDLNSQFDGGLYKSQNQSRSSSKRQKSISFGNLPKSKNNIQFQTLDGLTPNDYSSDEKQSQVKKKVTTPHSVKVNKIDLSKVAKVSVIQKINEFLDFSRLNQIVNQQKNKVMQVQAQTQSPLYNLKKQQSNQSPHKQPIKNGKTLNNVVPSYLNLNSSKLDKKSSFSQRKDCFQEKNTLANHVNSNMQVNFKTQSSGNSNDTLNSNRASFNEKIASSGAESNVIFNPLKNYPQPSIAEVKQFNQLKQKNIQLISAEFPQLMNAFKAYSCERIIKEIFIESDRVIRHLSRDFFIFKIKFFLFQLQKLELDGFFDLCDLNCDKFVDVKEFGEIIENFCNIQNSDSKKLKVIYQNIDYEKYGSISQMNLLAYLQKYIPRFQQKEWFCLQFFKEIGHSQNISFWDILLHSNNRMVRQLIEESPIDRKMNQ